MLRRQLIYMFVFGTVCLLAGCEDKSVTATLSDVSSLIEKGRSDSALIMLDSLQSGDVRLGRHSRMLCRLYRQNAYNKLDTLFCSTEEAQALADYKFTIGAQLGMQFDYRKWFFTLDFKHSFTRSQLNCNGFGNTLQFGVGYNL